MPASGTVALPHLVSSSFPIFASPGLSLAIEQAEIENNHQVCGDGPLMGGNFDARRSREEENDSRSGSGDLDGASGDDQDASDNRPRKKRNYRHTPQQIQELEALFKENPHPDEKQRLYLSKRLCLEPRQVKFWFQNRRTQLKMQLERHENSLLRRENDKLRAENMSIRDAMRNPICTNCGGPAIIGDVSLEEQHLRIENARLKDELDRVCALAGKLLGRPISSLPPPISDAGLELAVGSNGYGGLNTCLPLIQDFSGVMNSVLPVALPPNGMDGSPAAAAERSMLLELALAAMGELVKMAQAEEPLWIQGPDGGREVLNEEEYLRSFGPCIGPKPSGFITEASRETGIVIINSLALVESLMEWNRWSEMFPCLVARSCTTHVICSGMGGTGDGALQLMEAEVEVVSPLVPVREVSFLRFCKQQAEGVWAVVDVSVGSIRDTVVSCRRLPSGCLVQDMPNGYSKVTWVEHTEYDESQIHPLYRQTMKSGMGLGAPRWLATLQRQCEGLAILMSSDLPAHDHASAITSSGRRSMLKLAQRMTHNFCAGVCSSKPHKWNRLSGENLNEDVRLMTRKSVDDPGEPSGVVLSAATSVWLHVSPQKLFDFLRDERLRSEWDILSNGGPMQEMAHIAKGHDQANCVSLLRASAMNANESSMLVLQETCTDATGSLVVYAPVDIPAMQVVMNGGDSSYVALLPSGFAIAPDGNGSPTEAHSGGSLLTVAFQILVNSLPTAKLTVESVETVNNLISCTVQKIKGALHLQSDA